MLLLKTSADWLSPGAVVVGTLTIEREGLLFRSLVPNPARAIDIGIDQIVRVDHVRGNTIRVMLRAGDTMTFRVPEPSACVLALEQAIATYAAGGAYR
jgi:hypothetical protein